jgi:hypothetical protein
LYEGELSLHTWDHYQEEKYEDIEKVERYSSDEVHISIEIGRDVLLKGREYDIPYHDPIEDEKGEDTGEVGEDVCEHREEGLGDYQHLSFMHKKIYRNLVYSICLLLYPVLIGFIGCDFLEFHDTGDFVFMARLYVFFYFFIVFSSSLIDRDDLLGPGEGTFPPVHTLDREVVRAGDEVLMEKLCCDPIGFWLRWMCDVDKEK